MSIGHLSKPVVWLLEFEYSGRVYRFADRAVTVTDSDGQEHVYQAGLNQQTLGRSVTLDGAASATVEIDSNIDWARIFAETRAPLNGHRGTLKRHLEGLELEHAETMVLGTIREVQYGAVNESLTFVLERISLTDKGAMPNPLAVVDENTQPMPSLNTERVGEVPEKSFGAAYPIIIGYPGWNEKKAFVHPVVPVPVANLLPGVYVQESVILVADRKIEATECKLLNTKIGRAKTLPISHAEDLLGRIVSVTDFQTDRTIEPQSDADTYLAGFSPEGGGGILGADGKVIRGAGDVIQWMLDEFTNIPLDRGRLEANRDFFNGWKIDTYVNNAVDPVVWLESEILPLLPAKLVVGSQGLWFAPMRYDARRSDIQWYLDASENGVSRQDKLKPLGSGEVYNHLLFEYAPTGDNRKYYRRILLTAEFEKDNDPYSFVRYDDERIIGDRRCAVSQGLFGVRNRTFSSKAVWDRATAFKTAKYYASLFALPKQTVTYSVGLDWAKADIGDVILLNDEEVYLTDRLALVDEMGLGSEGITMKLILLDEGLI